MRVLSEPIILGGSGGLTWGGFLTWEILMGVFPYSNVYGEPGIKFSTLVTKFSTLSAKFSTPGVLNPTYDSA